MTIFICRIGLKFSDKMTNFSFLISNKFPVKIIFITAAVLLLVFFKDTGKVADQNIEKIYSLARGELQPDTNIVIININENDIDRVGPWPLKRSYYALLIDNLSRYKVKRIGLEIFLSARYVTQTIYDNLLVSEIRKSGNVVLSSLAGSIYLKDKKFYTDSLSYPSPKLLDENFKTGHLNYIDGEGIKIPVELIHDNVKEKAFSVQLAGENNLYSEGMSGWTRLEDSHKNEKAININFISSWKKFRHYSLIRFFNLVQKQSSELESLKGKTVIIGISDPQIAATIQTVFDDALPGVALHAFSLDNILLDRAINTDYVFSSALIFLIVLILLLFYQYKKNDLKNLKFYLVAYTMFFAITFIVYSFFNIRLFYSLFLFPFVAMTLLDIIFYFYEHKYKLRWAIDEGELLRTLLSKKEKELADLQSRRDVFSEESEKNNSENNRELNDKIALLRAEIEKLKNNDDQQAVEEGSLNEADNFHSIIYRSRSMEKIVNLIKKAAPEDANILILGESGTGKELAAKAIHLLSKRNKNNFVAVNCGALSDTLLESELFGHVKGAFTGSVADKVGRFEAADKGTIFLDEIAETSENFQVKLLRVIQTGDYEKVGSSKTSHADVRIVAATNKNLETEVRDKKFREDLYYRLNVIKIELPPLRERKEDIEILAHHFLSKEKLGLKLSQAVLQALIKYSWKGNIRELEAVIKRAAIFAKSAGREIIQLADLPENVIRESRTAFEDLVIESLRNKKFSHSSVSETARELGNVNRTLISENFRGLAFKVYVESNYNIEHTVKLIAAADDEEIKNSVRSKIETFLSNIERDVKKAEEASFEAVKPRLISKYKNLPQKFHTYLDDIIKKILSGN